MFIIFISINSVKFGIASSTENQQIIAANEIYLATVHHEILFR